MIDKINNLKQRLQDSKVSKGCIHYFPDELKQEALLLHLESKLSLRKFAPMIGSCPRTMKSWRDYFGMEKPKATCPNYHRMLEPDVIPIPSRAKQKPHCSPQSSNQTKQNIEKPCPYEFEVH